MRRELLVSLIETLRKGERPKLTVADFPCFGAEATEGNPHVSPKTQDEVAASLTAADIPTLERALAAIDAQEEAWLGFKVVYDAAEAQANVDNAVTKAYGDAGSADGQDLVFFCNDAKEIVASRKPSPRDVFQMKDVTRGPSMHTEQFAGLTWVSQPLLDPVKVWLLGASDVAAEVAVLADHVGFAVAVVDYDESYLNAKRFPKAERVLLGGGDFGELANMPGEAGDYVCVLTRGHMFDPEGCLWALQIDAAYIGMMGSAGKNERVRELVLEGGASSADWERIKRPIGLRFGAKTPAELAIAIVGELVDVRYRARTSAAAQSKHQADLGL